jgi:hypothetical protein
MFNVWAFYSSAADVDSITRNLRKIDDKMEGSVFYYSQKTPRIGIHTWKSNTIFCLYIEISENNETKLHLFVRNESEKINYRPFNRIILMAGEKRFKKSFDTLRRETYSPQSEDILIEGYDTVLKPEEVKAFDELLASNPSIIQIRYTGDIIYSERQLKGETVEALIEIVDVYKRLILLRP